MSNNVLENGVYTTTNAIPSSITSGAVFMAENELFDQVYVKETAKTTKSLSISSSNGVVLNGKDDSDYHNHYQRKISSVRLDPDERSTSRCSKIAKKYICNTVVLILLIAVAGMYSLGIIFFYTNVPENENFDYDTVRNDLLDQLELCKQLESSSNMPAQDNCISYNGACLDALQAVARNHSINTPGDSIMVQANTRAGNLNPDMVVNILRTFLISEECQTYGLPVLCQYFLPVCDPADGLVIDITEEQCTITKEVCQDLPDYVQAFIPDCTGFASESSTGMQMVNETVKNFTEMATANGPCHPQFDEHCGRCVPSCNRFYETTKERQRSIDIVFIIAAITCIIGGTFVIIVSVIRREVMLDFPPVLIVYMTIVMMVISVLVLVSYGYRDELYCTESELPLAYENPTFFCQFSGFLLHAGVLQIVLYWLVHLIHLFLKFIFPFAIRRYDTTKWKRIFHVTELLMINLLTVIGPIYVVLGSKYYPYGFPPVLCIPNSTLTFYGLVLPLILMLWLGTSIILLMFWRLQMREGFVRRDTSKISRPFRLTTAEFKIVILLCFFLTFGIVNAIYFSLYARNYDYVLSLALEYFVCQIDGNDESCGVHIEEIERSRYHGLANTANFLMGLLTISNFLFTIHVKQLRGQVTRLSVKAANRFRSTLNHSRGGANQSKGSKDSNKESKDSNQESKDSN